ncbi:MAG TPA: DNA polymerase III subunit gamma and tau [Lapillicoccus sp.]|nr:DNA polymerase III subunit gamma and tau [Lapillicoccus sp.]
MTTALYRRYRPETFRDVIGQEHVTEPLMQALRTGRVGHAYLFSGPRGCGKTTSARILARCLNCEQGPTPDPCGVCDSCVALSRGGAGTVDVIEIDAASHGGVDDARDLRERASYGPAQSRYKVYIIDEAHMVTPQGFNALLKIVEEPPEHVKFVFATTEPEKVIGTIRSRTHHYPFRLVPPARLTAYMEDLCRQERVSVAPGVLGFVTRAGGGSVRDSLSVLDQLIAGSGDEGLTYEGAASLLGFTDGELLDATIDALAAGDGAAVFTQIDKVIESGHDPRRFVEDLLERLRDLIIVAAVPDGAASVLRGVPEDQLERMRGQQSRFGPGALTRAADIVNAGLTEMTGATAPRMQLELICARILLPAASGPSGYAARLDRLERRLDLGGVPSSARPADSAPRETRPEPSEAAPRPAASTPPPASAAPTSAGGPRETIASTPQQAPPAEKAPAAETNEPTPAPAAAAPDGGAGLDTAALRRVWPDVLARIFTMRRVTWTFLSQHAQVVDFDGQRLVLGIATVGLVNTFRAGNHAELVRQALIDEIGVDVPVEGVPMPDAGAPSPTAAPPVPPVRAPEPATRPAPGVDPWTQPGAPPDFVPSAEERVSAGPGAGPAADEGSPAAAPASGSASASASAPAPARPAARRSAPAPKPVPAPAPVGEPDDAVSEDDENIGTSSSDGRAVVERVLGGQFLGELED